MMDPSGDYHDQTLECTVTGLKVKRARRQDGSIGIDDEVRDIHFDQRTQHALREVAGLSTDEIQVVSDAVVDVTRDETERLEAFFDPLDAVYSDMD